MISDAWLSSREVPADLDGQERETETEKGGEVRYDMRRYDTVNYRRSACCLIRHWFTQAVDDRPWRKQSHTKSLPRSCHLMLRFATSKTHRILELLTVAGSPPSSKFLSRSHGSGGTLGAHVSALWPQ